MDATVTWKNGLAFRGRSEENGIELDLDGYMDVGGQEGGLTPMQLFALGVGGCTAMDVISILQKKRQEVVDFVVQVHTERSESYPKIWTSVKIRYIVTGKAIDPAAVERAIELSHEKYCPAQNMLKQTVPIQHEYEIKEAQ